MTDDTDIPEDVDDEQTGVSVSFNPAEQAPIYVIEGANTTYLFNNPANPATPFHWIKNCVGMTQYLKPGSQAPDEVYFIIAIGDGFELRTLEECLNVDSEKEYTPKQKFRTVN